MLACLSAACCAQLPRATACIQALGASSVAGQHNGSSRPKQVMYETVIFLTCHMCDMLPRPSTFVLIENLTCVFVRGTKKGWRVYP